MKNKKLLGNALLLLTAMIWGSAFVSQRVGMETIEPITFNAARMALAAVAVGIVALIFWLRERRTAEDIPADERKSRTKHTVIGGVLCGTFLAIASIFQQMGIVYTTAGKAGFITAMYMLLVPIINFIVFRKKSSWLVWIAVLLGIAGMYFLCIKGSFSLTLGDTFVCISALFFSFHILCCDRFVKLGDPLRISVIQFATAFVISAVVALIFEHPTAEKLASAAVPIMYCGIVSGGIGYTLQIVAQKYTNPTVASLLMSMEAVFAVLAGAIFLNEQMTPRELIGCIIMLAAIVLVQIPLPKRKTKSTDNNSS